MAEIHGALCVGDWDRLKSRRRTFTLDNSEFRGQRVPHEHGSCFRRNLGKRFGDRILGDMHSVAKRA